MFHRKTSSQSPAPPPNQQTFTAQPWIRSEVWKRLSRIFSKNSNFNPSPEQTTTKTDFCTAEEESCSLDDLEFSFTVQVDPLFYLVINIPQNTTLIYDEQKAGISDPVAFTILQLTHFIPGLGEKLFTAVSSSICNQIATTEALRGINEDTLNDPGANFEKQFDQLFTHFFIETFSRVRIVLVDKNSGEKFEFCKDGVIDVARIIFIGEIFKRVSYD